MGVGQRIVKGAAHVGGVIVLGASARIRDVLVPVYERMGFAWDPATRGLARGRGRRVSRAAVVEALLAELGKAHASSARRSRRPCSSGSSDPWQVEHRSP